jgi:rare lipoprotein A
MPLPSRIVPLAAVALLAACAGPVLPPSPPQPASAAIEQPTFRQVGIASWYGKAHHGHITANGEIFDMHELTAAHRSLPFDTVVRVTNLANGKSVQVRINDRGPYVQGRVVDLSAAAARQLGIVEKGTVEVRIEAFASDQATEEAVK